MENIRFNILRPASCILFLFHWVFVLSACYLDTFPDTLYHKTPQGWNQTSNRSYLYYRHLDYCSNFIWRNHVQISCFMHDFQDDRLFAGEAHLHYRQFNWLYGNDSYCCFANNYCYESSCTSGSGGGPEGTGPPPTPRFGGPSYTIWRPSVQFKG